MDIDLRKAPLIEPLETDDEPVNPVSTLTMDLWNGWISTAGTTITVWSNTIHNATLGMFDQLVLQAVTNQASAGTGTLSLAVSIEHSVNGIHWLTKFSGPVINAVLNTTGPTYPPIAVDDGSTPSLGLVRVSITLSAPGGPVSAYVSLTATANDLHEAQFAKEANDFRAANSYSSSYYLCYGPGSLLTKADFDEYKLEAAVEAGVISYQIWSLPIALDDGVKCCFNSKRDFVLVRDNVIIWASNPYDFSAPAHDGGAPPGDGYKGPPQGPSNDTYEPPEDGHSNGANLGPGSPPSPGVHIPVGPSLHIPVGPVPG
jgi:hypothetical protein